MRKLLLKNARILTLNRTQPVARSLLAENGRITALDVEVSTRSKGDIQVLDLEGKTVLPGFIDSHVHLATDAGFMAAGITADFEKCDTIEKVLDLVMERISKVSEGQWLVGRRLHKELLFQMNRRMLDSVCPNIPVWLTAHGWHFCLVNSLALQKAGIKKETPQPEGGEIQKDPTGDPTGVLIQKAMVGIDSIQMPDAVMPPYSIDQYKHAIKAGCQQLIQVGVTTIHDILVSPDEVRAYTDLLHESKLPLRANLVFRVGWGLQSHSRNPKYGESKIAFDSIYNLGLVAPFGNEWLSFSGLKFSIDDMTGKIRIPEDELTARLIEANKMNQRFLVHAVSYNAMEIALRSIEKALTVNPRKDHRHRIEHSGNSNCSIQHIRKMKELGIIASLNPGFIYFFGAKEFIDLAREENDIFPLRSLEENGLTTIMNTDFGAIPPDPFKAIYFAVTRRTMEGTIVVPQQSISVETAIRQYTINAAYAGFEESTKGTLDVGKVADMIVVSEDPTVMDGSRIMEIRVIKTIINGDVVHDIES